MSKLFRVQIFLTARHSEGTGICDSSYIYGNRFKKPQISTVSGSGQSTENQMEEKCSRMFYLL